MEARNRRLPDWLTRIRTRQLVLPRFQRMEAWGYREITDLMQMLLRGLPVGAVLVLDVGNRIPFISRALETAPTHGDRINELLLDGQQRLTAIWRTLNNNYPDRTYFISMTGDDHDGEVEVVPISRWNRNGVRYPVWANDPNQCWERRLIPINLFRPEPKVEPEVDRWIEQVTADDTKLDKQLSLGIERLRQKLVVYNLPFLSLGVDTAPEVVLDVFVKMNTRSVSLTAFDIVVAQTEEATGESLHDLVEGLKASVPGLSDYDKLEDVALNVMALLQDRPPNQSGYLGLNFERMVNEWPNLVHGAVRTVNFLEDEKVFDSRRLPTESVLAPLIALWSKVPEVPDAQGNARILLRKYLWRAFFTDRYERAAATAALQDYRALRDVLYKTNDETMVPCFNEEQYPLPTKAALVQANWPKKRDRLARAVLLLSLRGGALDLADGKMANRSQIDTREYHHIFPVAYLRDKGISDSDANRALNCALISWLTNRTIAAKEPVQYLLERAKASTLGETEIVHRLKTHVISHEDMVKGDYEVFLDNRAENLISAIRALCDGYSWHPQL